MSTVATARVYGAGCSARRSRADRRAEARHTASQPSMTASPAWAPSASDSRRVTCRMRSRRVPVEAIDPLREVQRLLHLPDLVVPVECPLLASGHTGTVGMTRTTQSRHEQLRIAAVQN